MNKSLHIDTLRGIACLLLVAYHIIGSTSSLGLKLDVGLYRDVNDFLVYLRMPLFTFLSGFVYALRPFSGDFSFFIRGKVRRLILPLLVVGTTFAVLQSLVPGTNVSGVSNWWLLHIIPVAHYWYLEALFIIYLFMALIDHLKLASSTINAALILCVSSVFYILDLGPKYFAIREVFYLFPFFIVGLAYSAEVER